MTKKVEGGVGLEPPRTGRGWGSGLKLGGNGLDGIRWEYVTTTRGSGSARDGSTATTDEMISQSALAERQSMTVLVQNQLGEMGIGWYCSRMGAISESAATAL